MYENNTEFYTLQGDEIEVQVTDDRKELDPTKLIGPPFGIIVSLILVRSFLVSEQLPHMLIVLPMFFLLTMIIWGKNVYIKFYNEFMFKNYKQPIYGKIIGYATTDRYHSELDSDNNLVKRSYLDCIIELYNEDKTKIIYETDFTLKLYGEEGSTVKLNYWRNTYSICK